jgi:hypothetical protein
MYIQYQYLVQHTHYENIFSLLYIGLFFLAVIQNQRNENRSAGHSQKN